jgi:hypothetical protein
MSYDLKEFFTIEGDRKTSRPNLQNNLGKNNFFNEFKKRIIQNSI